MAVFDDMDQERKLTVHDKGPVLRPASEWQVRTGDIHIPRVSTEEPLRIECRHFVSLVSGEEDRLGPARDGLAVVRTLEMLQGSLDRAPA
jgi:predicted dehydrogenase